MQVSITADGTTIEVRVPAGSTVQQALDQAELVLSPLDRVDPPSYTLLTEGASVRLTRVIEEFEVEQEVIPFEQRRQPTELLPDGEVRQNPLQPGETGLREITYRIVHEDGVEISKARSNRVVKPNHRSCWLG
jgi:uncharacterized protein YabE (DUF348 family)